MRVKPPIWTTYPGPLEEMLRPALRQGGAPGFAVQAAPTTAEDCGGKRPASVGRPGALRED